MWHNARGGVSQIDRQVVAADMCRAFFSRGILDMTPYLQKGNADEISQVDFP